MPFNSYEFVFGFLPITVLIFWLLSRHINQTAATCWLLLSSIVFYAYASVYALIIIASYIFVDYGLARLLLRLEASKQRLRKGILLCGITTNILFLAYFKYNNFFLENINAILATNFEVAHLIFPLGVSFLTFQNIAFLVDVYEGAVTVVEPLDFLLFAFFFPRIVAGPIIHYCEVIPQLKTKTPTDLSTNLAVGICLFSIGLFKKSVIADSLSGAVGDVFDQPPYIGENDMPHTLIISWVGALAYTFQLYFDFSGYSDMALGTARMFGVQLPMNFNSPFKAVNVIDFWSRWHITLTRFLTTYIYTPIAIRLTRSRLSKGKTLINGSKTTVGPLFTLIFIPTMITMVISGFWHGAGWQFILWGVLHGIYITINQSWHLYRRIFSRQANFDARLLRFLGSISTFTAVVAALVLFRAASVTAAGEIFAGMAGINGVVPYDVSILEKIYGSIPAGIFSWELQMGQIYWIIFLLLFVRLLPNSLELLKKFDPALDFRGSPPERSLTPAQTGIREKPVESKTDIGAVRRVINRLRYVPAEGISLTKVAAIATAIVFMLGVTALNHSSGFLYGHF